MDIQQIIKKIKHIATSTSPLLVIAGVSFCIVLILSLYPHNIFQTQKTAVKHSVKAAHTLSLVPITLPTNTPISEVSSNTNNTQSTPTATSVPTHTETTNSNPTPTNAPQQQVQQATVAIQISEPDGMSNFSLPVGGNACDELTEAKQEGKIRSVTFSSNYMSSMHSLYVSEMNGYSNNWTFIVNGQGPAGCSLSSPQAGDTVVWKFN